MDGATPFQTPRREQGAMIDPFGRRISYLRLSVTDRCDLRCAYCMAERMTFLPKRELLTLEELDRLASRFVTKGVRKIRLTGGEPLVRRDVMSLVRALSRHLVGGDLDELTLTTNATRLAEFAEDLARAGVRRVNVSLDSLDPDAYGRITRGGRLERAIEGIDAARAAGIAVKVNCVALKNDNADAVEDMMVWAHGRGLGFTLIEVMPLGDVGVDRLDQYAPLDEIRARLSRRFTLVDLAKRTGGPARYARVAETGGEIGFITPLTGNFCDGCNRVRVSCVGELHQCLGQSASVDLRAPLRASADDDLLSAAIDAGLAGKPFGHDFRADRRGAAPALQRHMSVTGG
ncbi:MAG: GTP 3',8-cyclase MoaA [Parvularculaceae bacterium]